MNPWVTMLEALDLSKTEKSVVDRFKADPDGRNFLPVSDILRTHNRIEECLELLSAGIEKHPGFTVARVVLARELFNRGMVANAWQSLQDSPSSLADNVLAQKLLLKLSILLEKVAEFRVTREHMQSYRMLDDECNKLSDMVALSGIQRAKDSLIQELRSRGIEPVIPELSRDINDGDDGSVQISREDQIDAENIHVGSPSEIEGYHVVPLGEVFSGANELESQHGDQSTPFELDSTTLAEIYVKQEHYSKALEVYKRLMRITPNSDFLRNKVRETSRLIKEQKEQDVNVDPVLADQMEQVEILNRQMRFYNDILEKLS